MGLIWSLQEVFESRMFVLCEVGPVLTLNRDGRTETVMLTSSSDMS